MMRWQGGKIAAKGPHPAVVTVGGVMEEVYLLVEDLDESQLSILESAEAVGTLTLPGVSDDLHEPGLALTAVACTLANLAIVAAMLVAWKARIRVVVQKTPRSRKTEVELDFGKGKLDPKAAAAMIKSAFGSPEMQ
jgi:hypothetical protein